MISFVDVTPFVSDFVLVRKDGANQAETRSYAPVTCNLHRVTSSPKVGANQADAVAVINPGGYGCTQDAECKASN